MELETCLLIRRSLVRAQVEEPNTTTDFGLWFFLVNLLQVDFRSPYI